MTKQPVFLFEVFFGFESDSVGRVPQLLLGCCSYVWALVDQSSYVDTLELPLAHQNSKHRSDDDSAFDTLPTGSWAVRQEPAGAGQGISLDVKQLCCADRAVRRLLAATRDWPLTLVRLFCKSAAG